MMLMLFVYLAQSGAEGVAKVAAEEVAKLGTQSVIVQLIGQVGVIGVLIWYLWYTQSKVLPKKDEQHIIQVDNLTDRHEKRVKEIVESFKDDMKQEREFRATENQNIRQAIRDSIERVMGRNGT